MRKVYKQQINVIFFIFYFMFLLFVDKGIAELNFASVMPRPQKVELRDGTFDLKCISGIAVDMSDDKFLSCARFLAKKIAQKNGQLAIADNACNLNNKIVLLNAACRAAKDFLITKRCGEIDKMGDEGYVLNIDEDKIVIIAHKGNGLFYGIITLIQLIDKCEDGKIRKICILDYPRVKVRAVHFLNIDYAHIKEQLDMMAELKFNAAIFFDWGFFNIDKNYDFARKINEIFNYARERFIEPIPEISALGSALPILKINPGVAEGMWIRDIRFKFNNDAAEPLNQNEKYLTNVIRSEETDIVITNSNKDKIFSKNTDYEIIDGSLQYPYLSDSTPWKIVRRVTGQIRPGEEILVSYDCMKGKYASEESWEIPYCLSSEAAYKIVTSGIENTVKLLNPGYISLGYSEIKGMNRDSRCLKRNLTNAELLAGNFNKVYDFTKKKFPKVGIIIWDDMFNPIHNGGDDKYQMRVYGAAGRTAPALDLLPKDVFIIIWWYDKEDWLKKMAHSPKYFSKKGFNFFVSCWKDQDNIKKWLQGDIVTNKKFQGIIAATWDGWGNNIEGIICAAKSAWND